MIINIYEHVLVKKIIHNLARILLIHVFTINIKKYFIFFIKLDIKIIEVK